MSFGHALNVRTAPFLAKGDWNEGTLTGTDDTLAFQAAIDAAQGLGCPVVVPPGSYKITQRPGTTYAVQLRTGTHIYGVGRPTIRIADDVYEQLSTDYNAFQAVGGVSRVRIEGLRFQGNNSPYDRTQETGYNAAVCFTGHADGMTGAAVVNYDIEILNNEFLNLFGFACHGIYELNYNFRWNGNVIRQCSNGFNPNASGEITNNYFEDSPGIEHYSGNVLIANNRFRRATNIGIALGGGGALLDGVQCIDNIIESSISSGGGHAASGIAIGSGIRNVIVKGNCIFGTADVGLVMHNGGLDPLVWAAMQDVLIDNMTIRGCGTNGIYITDGVGPVTIQNTRVTDTGSYALNVRGVNGLFLGRGNYWRTNHANATDWLLQEFAFNVTADESNDFRRKTSDFDPAATVLWA